MERVVAHDQPGGRRADPRPAAPPALARLVLNVPAAVEHLRPLRREVEQWARAHGVDENELIDLQLALGEAVSNAIEHAYVGAAEPGGVDVTLEIRAADPGRELAGRVVDRGRWKPATSRPRHRGRGLAMIEGLSTSMRVTSTGTGTEVTFTMPLGES
jgi:anti-sigma regulatory factor (Ser/Thr protein kinase)